jgi:hypothetical protein
VFHLVLFDDGEIQSQPRVFKVVAYRQLSHSLSPLVWDLALD